MESEALKEGPINLCFNNLSSDSEPELSVRTTELEEFFFKSAYWYPGSISVLSLLPLQEMGIRVKSTKQRHLEVKCGEERVFIKE